MSMAMAACEAVRMKTIAWAVLGLLAASVSYAGREADIHDADTLAWWHTTVALSGDEMEGRDTGSPAYQRAAEYVAKRFEAAGLKPAGENSTWFQTVPMHDVDLLPEGTNFPVIRDNRVVLDLPFLKEITATP